MNFQQQTHCLNCKAPLHTPFCAQCGQEKARRIEFSELFRIFQEGIIEMKSPFLKLMWDMTVRPTETIKAYLGGQRTKYYNPFKYCLYIALSYIIISNLLGIDHVSTAVELAKSDDESDRHMLEVIINNGLLYGNFLFALLFAIPVKLVFRNNTYNLAELYIAQLLLYSHFSFLLSPISLFGGTSNIVYFASVLIFIVMVVVCLRLRKSQQHTARDTIYLLLTTIIFFAVTAITATFTSLAVMNAYRALFPA
ncbi:DUF3667 domain-containing protein (plasmid) [Pseudoalteromonas sp. T1lg65]|uniref:DUF3667 domain-containing protein n=1 Tax=Pseudoalteromonas sp. T1lg65 TaxID=2077101 RepID=UPI003F78C188